MEGSDMADSWNTLEVAKLVVSVLTPLVLLLVGLVLIRRVEQLKTRDEQAFEQRQAEAARRSQSVQWANQTVIEARLVLGLGAATVP
jgi:hypothetical protein